MKRLSLYTLARLDFWTFVFSLTLFTVLASEALIILQSYLLKGAFFDTELLLVGLVTSTILGMIIAWSVQRFRAHLMSPQNGSGERGIPLQYALEHSIDPYFLIDPSGHFIDFNVAANTHLGYSREELKQMGVPDIDADHTSMEWPDLFQTLKERGSMRFRIRHQTKDGRTIPVDVNASHVHFEGEEYALVFTRDVLKRERVEQALSEQRELLRSVIDENPDPIIVKDKDAKFILVNEACARLYGSSPEAMIGKDDGDYIPDQKQAEFFRQNVKEIMKKGKTEVVYEESIDVETGKRHLYRSVKKPYMNSQGEPQILVLAHDITEERKAEEELRLMKYALDQISEAYYLIDKSGHLLKVNNRACLDLGYTNVELEGMPLADITDTFEATRWPEHMAGVRQKGAMTYETRHRRKDGSHFPVEVNTSYLEYKAESYIVALVHDITERVQEQEELRLMEYALEHMSDAYLLVDHTGHFKRVNEAACNLLGYSREELTSMEVVDIDPDFPKEQWSDEFMEIKRQGSFTKEARHKRKDGSIFPVEITINNILFQGNTYELGFVHDLSKRKAAEKKMKEQEEMLIAQSRSAAMGEMISMISHQWRQPLGVISMSANNLIVDIEFQESSEESLRAQANSILEQTIYLSRTIDDFRDFFRPDKDAEEVSLNDVMKEAAKIIGDSLRNNSIAFTVDVKDDHKFRLHSRELLQVYVNLINNAKEALLDNKVESPKIAIEIAEKNGQALTTICDNGGGIDVKTIDKIFDPYFSTKGVSSGTGLGLYIAKIIIEKHLKGTITAQNVDDGACFKLSIPMDLLPSD